MTEDENETGGGAPSGSAGYRAKPSEQIRAEEISGRSALAFFVVGIGASAGGLDAVKTLLRHLPDSPGMAFVVTQHLDPNHKSMLADLLGPHTSMPVTQVEDGIEVEPDHVYIIPPRHYLSMEGGRLILSDPVERRGMRMPIDFFLRSLAKDQGELSVAVILSGTASDGTMGVKAMKEVGGLTIAQDLAEAEYDGMPRSAIETGHIDRVASVADMPGIILQYVHHAFVAREHDDDHLADDTETEVTLILDLLKRTAQHDFNSYKRGTILRRIERRMGLTQAKNIRSYRERLANDPDELERLAMDMLISVTSFFRDPEAFKIIEKKSSPSSARGRRPRRASAFVYPESIVADVSPERLNRFFIRDGDTFRIRKIVRDTVTFAFQNLVADPPFSNIDLISCRNLLIYLKGAAQGRALQSFHFALKHESFLFLGTAESISSSTRLFRALHPRWRIYQRAQGRTHESRPTHRLIEAHRGAVAPSSMALPPRPPSLRQLADRAIVEASARAPSS